MKINRLVFLLLLLTKVSWSQTEVKINEYTIDEANNKIYLGGNFTAYKGQARDNAAAIDGSTGNVLKWDPKLGPDRKVISMVYDKNEIFVLTDWSNHANLFAIDSNGVIKRDLSGAFEMLIWPKCMTVADDLVYISAGQLEDEDINITYSAVLYRNGGLVPTPSEFNLTQCKKIAVGATKICMLTDDKLFVFNKSDYTLYHTYSFGTYGKSTDCVVSNDTAYISGNFYWDGSAQGGMKLDLRAKIQVDWEFNYVDSTCYTPPTKLYPCEPPYQYNVSTIALNGPYVFVGGKIASRNAGTCSTVENPRQLRRNFSYPLSEPVFKKLFDNRDRKIRGYKIANDKLYYINALTEGCSGAVYKANEVVAAYCLTPSPPKGFVNVLWRVCEGVDNMFEVIPAGPGKKYVWSTNVPGAVINSHGNTASINFPYYKLEGSVSVAIENECGMLSEKISTTVFIQHVPDVYVSGEEKILTCSRTSFPMKAISMDSTANFLWTYPNGSQSRTEQITVTEAGTYYIQATNPNTGCFKTETVVVTRDTVKPVITNSLTHTITSCNPFEVTVNGQSDNSADKIDWFGNNVTNTNPVVLKELGNYTEEVTRTKNGCKTRAIVKVITNVTVPNIIPPATAAPTSTGVIVDTITCTKTSVLMNFTSAASSYEILIKRPPPFNDTVPNNSYVSAPGIYTVYVKDLNTLCKGNALLAEVKLDKSLPQLLLPTHIPTINCSFSEAVLDGKSGTPGAQLVWTGSGGFSSADPATVTKPGEYILTVTDPHNGCIKKDTLEVIKENSLVLKGQADTIICIGSEIELTTKPVGGTPAFTYAWSSVAGNNASIKVKPVTTTSYSVTVIDATNCVGKDTIVVKVPAAIHDSTITFAPCDPASINGQIQIYASGGIPPYMYSNDKGITYQNSQIFSNLAFGTYQLSVKDSLGCTHDFSKSIDAQSQKPTSDFIINTTMMAKDTFVVVDISNPRPDTIIWKFPATVKVVNTNFYAPIIVSSDTGAVEVIMETHFGSCVNNLTKKVKFIKKDTTISPTKGNGIEELNIFPNPNNGEFTVEVKLFKKQRLAIYVFDTQGVEQIRVVEPIVDYSINNIVLPVKTPGTYILKVIAEYDSKAKGIIVTQ